MKKIIAASCLAGAVALPGLVQAREVTLTTQLKDYSGNDAYLAIYVTNATGQYQKNPLGGRQEGQVLQASGRLGPWKRDEPERV